MYVCNHRGDSITTFRVDGGGRELRFTGQYTPVGSPAVITFLFTGLQAGGARSLRQVLAGAVRDGFEAEQRLAQPRDAEERDDLLRRQRRGREAFQG